jgi:hypothetical protein
LIPERVSAFVPVLAIPPRPEIIEETVESPVSGFNVATTISAEEIPLLNVSGASNRSSPFPVKATAAVPSRSAPSMATVPPEMVVPPE